MRESDLLTVLAEIALGTAGFAGIIVTMGTRSGTWSPLDKERVRMLLLCSLPVVVFALVPLGLFAKLDDVPCAWQVSSGSYLPALVYALWRTPIVFRLASEHSGPTSRPLGFLLSCMQSLAALLLLANVAILSQPWPHLAALGLNLCIALIIFVELLLHSLEQT